MCLVKSDSLLHTRSSKRLRGAEFDENTVSPLNLENIHCEVFLEKHGDLFDKK